MSKKMNYFVKKMMPAYSFNRSLLSAMRQNRSINAVPQFRQVVAINKCTWKFYANSISPNF